MKTPAERLKWVRQEAGYDSAADFARRHGLTEVTYRAHENGLRGLSERTARRYAAALRGANWVWLLTGSGEPFDDGSTTPSRTDATAEPVPAPPQRTVAIPPVSQLPRDVEVLGVAVGGSEGEFMFNGTIADYVRRPPGIASADQIFGLYVVGDSMAPRFEDGDLIYVHKGRRPSVGNDVVIELHGLNGQAGQCFVKRLLRRSSERVVVHQFNPEEQIEFPTKDVRQIYKVLTTAELLGV